MEQVSATGVSAGPVVGDAKLPRLVAGFQWVCRAVVGVLPGPLGRLVAPTFVGYLLVNGLTFGVDLLLLTLSHGVLRLPVGVAVTVSYMLAFALSYLLNRTLNFASHGRVGRQLVIYVVVVAVNFLVFIFGITTGLTALGIEYRFARILGGMGEAVYMYAMMRWVVFRR